MPGPCFPGAITAAPSSLFPLCFQESTYISEMQREESFGTHPVLNIRALAVPCSAFEWGFGGGYSKIVQVVTALDPSS